MGDETVDGELGSAIYTPPDTLDGFENTGDERLRWLDFWRAPGGRPVDFESRS